MILNKIGDVLEYNGTKFTVGQQIVVTMEGLYQGLLGIITEIRVGTDQETENDTPDIYCDFAVPVLPYDAERLREKFSELYHEERTLENIPLDCVIMAPEMIQSLSSCTETHSITFYMLEEDWAVDDEYGHNYMIYGTYLQAKTALITELKKEQETGCIYRWTAHDSFCEDSAKDLYEAWLDGEYLQNHYQIRIYESKLDVSESWLTKLGREFIAQNQKEDFLAQISEVEEVSNLSDEQYSKLIADPNIADRIQKALGRNHSYWDSYWDTISEVIRDMIKQYAVLGHPKCFSPEPDNPYPLCIGNGSKDCNECCLYVHMKGEGDFHV